MAHDQDGERVGKSTRGQEIHHGHRDITGGWLRPAVFGAMDGLVSNVSLISGVAGSNAGARFVLLAGVAGLVSGALSMATGEYTSVRAQNEAMRREIDVERRELVHSPRAELAELAGVYRRRGVEEALADEVARQLSLNPETALEVHAREELGVHPAELPSPMLAAVSSFGSFATGAVIPLLPYLFGAHSFVISAVLTAVALFGVGVAVSRFTLRSPTYSGARQLLLGAFAAAATYGIGALVGTTVT
ncbi:MAG: VIT1/CCC1 transporter family protein [Frankia sp.]